MTTSYSRAAALGKRLFIAGAALALAASTAARPPIVVTVSRASRVALIQTGVHTHANFLEFDTGSRDVQAMQRGPKMFPRLFVKAHSRLPTNRAALPPDLAAFANPNAPPLANPYGAIDGSGGGPGWSVLPGHRNGRNIVTVLVPTRFVNWLAAQTPARRRAYASPKNYSLSIAWGGTLP